MTPGKLCVFQKAIICAEKKISLHPPVYISPTPLFDRGGIKQAAQQWLNDPPGGFFCSFRVFPHDNARGVSGHDTRGGFATCCVACYARCGRFSLV